MRETHNEPHSVRPGIADSTSLCFCKGEDDIANDDNSIVFQGKVIRGITAKEREFIKKTAGGSIWHYKGTINAASFKVLVPRFEISGDVYNVSEPVEVYGVLYPAYTNFVCINAGTDDEPVYKWDSFGGAYPEATDETPGIISKNQVRDCIPLADEDTTGLLTKEEYKEFKAKLDAADLLPYATKEDALPKDIVKDIWSLPIHKNVNDLSVIVESAQINGKQTSYSVDTEKQQVAVINVTKPCYVYLSVEGFNTEQKPGIIPMPYVLAYQVSCNKYNDGAFYTDGYSPNNNGGCFAAILFEVTNELLDEEGGCVELKFVIRSRLYPDKPISTFQQTLHIRLETYDKYEYVKTQEYLEEHYYDKKATDANFIKKGEATNDTYVCKYNETQFKEIYSKLLDGKIVQCNKDNYMYSIMHYNDSYALFCRIDNNANGATLDVVQITVNNIWNEFPSYKIIETTSRRVTYINNNSDNVHYPSAKAVYDFIKANTVTIEQQTFTDQQKAIARQNIGASNVEIDLGLTETGYAADAKIVGDKFKYLWDIQGHTAVFDHVEDLGGTIITQSVIQYDYIIYSTIYNTFIAVVKGGIDPETGRPVYDKFYSNFKGSEVFGTQTSKGIIPKKDTLYLAINSVSNYVNDPVLYKFDGIELKNVDTITDSDLYVEQYVDLGLPSGTLWANHNLGAVSPEGYGIFVQWGSIEGHVFPEACNHSRWETTPFNDGNSTYNEEAIQQAIANGDIVDEVLAYYNDIATVALGEGWRMPTKDDFQELIDNTTVFWTTINGVNGYIFRNKNNAKKYIFLPAAGGCDNGSYIQQNSSCYYWASNLDTDDNSKASYFAGNSSNKLIRTVVRYPGYAIRPVTKIKPSNVIKPELIKNTTGDLSLLETHDKLTLVDAINNNARDINELWSIVDYLYDAVSEPIILSPSTDKILRWYYLYIKPGVNNGYVHTNNDSTHLSYYSEPLLNDDRFLWAFVGNHVEGFKIYNKAHQQFVECNGGANSLAIRTYVGTLFNLSPSANASYPYPYFCLRCEYNSQTLYLNKLGNGIGMWTGNDIGSTFKATPVTN